tara:strand:- start:115 stop:399 length:285 start_codon:yes stop_codon:yes gene_type:complete
MASMEIRLVGGFFTKIESFARTLGVLVLGYAGIGWIYLLRWYNRYSECKDVLDNSLVCEIGKEEMGLMGLEALVATIIGLYLLRFSVEGYWYRR